MFKEDKPVEHAEPWRCTVCGLFVYNRAWIDGGVYPVSGAPLSKFISVRYPKACTMCFQMYAILNTEEYWKDVQAEEDKKNRNNRKLFPGEDYLAL